MRFNPWRSWVTDHYSPTTQFTIKIGLLFTANLNELVKFIQKKTWAKKIVDLNDRLIILNCFLS